MQTFVFRFEEACFKIVEADGKIVDERKDYGKRDTIQRVQQERKRGGKREREQFKVDDNDMNKKSLRTHPDAIEGMNKKIEASVETYESVKLEIQNSQQRPEILRPNSRSEQI